MLPTVVRERLQAHLSEVKRQHELDLTRGVGRVVLPFALDRKYPKASTDWASRVRWIGSDVDTRVIRAYPRDHGLRVAAGSASH